VHVPLGAVNHQSQPKSVKNCGYGIMQQNCVIGGTRAMHYAKISSQSEVGFRRFSCVCQDCLSGNFERCGLAAFVFNVFKELGILK